MLVPFWQSGSPLPAIRVGLKQVKGMSRTDLASIVAARAEGPFASLADFCQRTTVPRDVVENLILCGAFDSLNPHRRELLWELPAALQTRVPPPPENGQLVLTEAEGVQAFRRSGVQGSGGDRGKADPEGVPRGHPQEAEGSRQEAEGGQEDAPTPQHPNTPTPQHLTPELPELTLAERVQWEIEVLGFCIDTHPTALFRRELEPYELTTAAELSRLPEGTRVRTGGVVLCRMRPPTRSGTVVVFITLEDETGLVDTVIFPRVYEEYGAIAFGADLLVVEGRVQRQGKRGVALIAEKLFHPLAGKTAEAIDGRTGFARREVVMPDYDPEEETLLDEDEKTDL
jgi:error-prone DNA polymerase